MKFSAMIYHPRTNCLNFWERSGQRSRSSSEKVKLIFVITRSVFVQFLGNGSFRFSIPICHMKLSSFIGMYGMYVTNFSQKQLDELHEIFRDSLSSKDQSTRFWELSVIQWSLQTVWTQHFVLCREVVLFRRLFCTECHCVY